MAADGRLGQSGPAAVRPCIARREAQCLGVVELQIGVRGAVVTGGICPRRTLANLPPAARQYLEKGGILEWIFQTYEELDSIIYDGILWETSNIANYRHCFIETEVRSW